MKALFYQLDLTNDILHKLNEYGVQVQLSITQVNGDYAQSVKMLETLTRSHLTRDEIESQIKAVTPAVRKE